MSKNIDTFVLYHIYIPFIFPKTPLISQKLFPFIVSNNLDTIKLLLRTHYNQIMRIITFEF